MPGLVPGIHAFGMGVANMLSFHRRRRIMNVKQRKIEVDDATATALEARAAAAGVSVPELIAQLVSSTGASAKVSSEELDDLDRQWAAIKAGEPTVAHDDVVHWIDTWGTPGFRPWHRLLGSSVASPGFPIN
jgi:predicted transcriptional regulator